MSRAFVFLNCDVGLEDAVIEKMRGISGVSQTMGLKGVYDIVAELHANSDKDMSKIVKKVRSIANVRSCLTIIAADKHNGLADDSQQ
jgi:uncharacterized protein with GYD domain